MNFSHAGKLWLEYHKANSKKNTVRAYEAILNKFLDKFGQNELNEISSDHVLEFLNDITDGRKQRTRKTRFSHLSTFFTLSAAT